jgi:hypothetical protein
MKISWLKMMIIAGTVAEELTKVVDKDGKPSLDRALPAIQNILIAAGANVSNDQKETINTVSSILRVIENYRSVDKNEIDTYDFLVICREILDSSEIRYNETEFNEVLEFLKNKKA